MEPRDAALHSFGQLCDLRNKVPNPPRASFSSHLLFGPTLTGTFQNLTLWAEAAGRQVKRITVAPATRRRLEASAPAYSGRWGTSGRARGDPAGVPARVTRPREEARASPGASQPALSGNEEREGGGALQAAATRELGGAGRARGHRRGCGRPEVAGRSWGAHAAPSPGGGGGNAAGSSRSATCYWQVP